MGLVTDWNVKETCSFIAHLSACTDDIQSFILCRAILCTFTAEKKRNTRTHTHTPKNLNVVLNIGNSKEIVFSFHFFNCWTQGARLKCELLLVNTQQGSFSQQRLFQSLIIFLTSSSNLLDQTPLGENHCPILWLNSMEIKSFFLFFGFFKKKFNSKAD